MVLIICKLIIFENIFKNGVLSVLTGQFDLVLRLSNNYLVVPVYSYRFAAIILVL